MTGSPVPAPLLDLAQSINSPLSTAERGAILAFAAVDGIAFSVVALPYAMLKSSERSDSFEPGFVEAYLRGGSYFGFWFGALALPIALCWIVISPKVERRRSIVFELTRTLLVGCALVLTLALMTVALGPTLNGGYVIHWKDSAQFGRATFYCCIAAAPLCLALRPLASWWFADATRISRPSATSKGEPEQN